MYVSKLIKRNRLAASMAFVCGMLCAGTTYATTATPGGNIALSGQASIDVLGAAWPPVYQGSCAMSVQAYLDPATAALTINQVQFQNPCNGFSVTALGLPWHGATEVLSVVDSWTLLRDAKLEIFEVNGPSPPLVYTCTNSKLWHLDWDTNNQANAPATSALVISQPLATTASGLNCRIGVRLFLSPFQTFH